MICEWGLDSSELFFQEIMAWHAYSVHSRMDMLPTQKADFPLSESGCHKAAVGQSSLLAQTSSSVLHTDADIDRGRPDLVPGAAAIKSSNPQISVCSEISRASSTSMPRYLTVDSSLECPSSSCTARRFFVRRYIRVAFVRRIECVP